MPCLGQRGGESLEAEPVLVILMAHADMGEFFLLPSRNLMTGTIELSCAEN